MSKPLISLVSSGIVPERLYGVAAEFSSAAELYEAAKKVRPKGFQYWDCYSPYAIHGLDHAMGLKKTWVGTFTLVGGLTGLLGGFLLETITSVYVYPLITQGKPFFSLPAFVPIIDLLMIILATIFTISGMTTLSLLPRLHHPLFDWEDFRRATQDGFFLVIEANDPKFHEKVTPTILQEIGGKNITYIGEEV